MGTIQQVVFKLDNEEYGFDIMKVNGIEKYQEIVKMPNSPAYVEGIINLRGEVLPVFNLRAKFNLKEKEANDDTKIIVAVTNGMKVGFTVDSVSEIMNIEDSSVVDTPRLLSGVDRRYVRSVAKMEDRMIILMDVDLIVSDEEKLSLGEVIEGQEENE